MNKYKDYKIKIFDDKSFCEQIEKARIDTNVNFVSKDFTDDLSGAMIPFNLEREYVDFLILNKRYKEAEGVLLRMRNSYAHPELQNFIEIYEYRLDSILHGNRNLKDAILEAKKEFNQHTITVISFVVGVVTIFGAANITIQNTNYDVALNNFFAIVLAIVILTLVAFLANNFFNKIK